jgi:hypothetical protein
VTTLCVQCDHVHSSTRAEHPGRWRCMKRPIEPDPPYRFLDPSYMPAPPYQRCQFINTHGDCPDFEPRREGKQ